MQLLQLLITMPKDGLMADLIKLDFLAEKTGVFQVLSEYRCTYNPEEILTKTFVQIKK